MTKEEKGEEERGMARGRRREEMVKGVGKKGWWRRRSWRRGRN